MRNDLHEGPYYGYTLRDLLTDRPPVTVSRARRLWTVGIIVIIAAISFAVLVNL